MSAPKLFNYTNQKLNAEKLRELQVFNSSDFCGIISDKSPFTISGSTVTLNASDNNPITFLGGGVLIDCEETVNHSFTNTTQENPYELWYLEVQLDSSVANITSDILADKISFKSTLCEQATSRSKVTYYAPVSQISSSPKANGYYEYSSESNKYVLTEDTEVYIDELGVNRIYYAKIEANTTSFKADQLGSSTYIYFGTTLWIDDNTFIIPLFFSINNELIQSVIVKNKDDFEKLLSLSTYNNLKKYLDENFVWSAGGEEWVKDSFNQNLHRKGDIGNLLISGDTIYNNQYYESEPHYPDAVNIYNLKIESLSNSENDQHTKLVIDENGKISVDREYITSLEHGGTGAANKRDAKKNLGIFYGTNDPNTIPPISNPTSGDIYFKIIE